MNSTMIKTNHAKASNSRASAGSQLFGFGLDYVEHVKYFITYRKPLSDS